MTNHIDKGGSKLSVSTPQKTKPNHADLMDWLTDHYRHFQALPMEYVEYDGDAETVFEFDGFMAFITDEDMDKIKRGE